ncbi:type II toxin-antitoxin system VapC family toxin [Xylophilus sp. GOD-11R]|uniref:type II toxin-antitoxin system VapC family toxin n=1 Tax=Xylophilus sp. GOD-11R TaxID=3089814 RepID=UPI00298D2794|nr:type II toxin-antitoxin system VapC family toxin [Xylophilus sp. GOD-11R]WPB56993.1 type II toxin-antitoxin system VapC family toxin [Xylophilus sp. GOD-11R]
MPFPPREGGMRVLFDTSALTKRYAVEEGRDRILDLFAATDSVVIAAHGQAEVASALMRRRQEGSLSSHDFDRAWAMAQQDVADMERVPLDAHVERFAFAAMAHAPLCATDALHIGSAMSARVDLFVTCDRRQAEAARQLGLQTEYVPCARKEAS